MPETRRHETTTPGAKMYVSASEAARRTGASIATIQRWCRAGILAAHVIGPGKRLRIDPADLEALIVPKRP